MDSEACQEEKQRVKRLHREQKLIYRLRKTEGKT
jgi:hypothetical protein